jgi:hypothetical protein
VVALDHQVLDNQVGIRDGREPARQRPPSGIDADRWVANHRLGHVLDNAGGQVLVKVVQATVVERVDKAAIQVAEVIHRWQCGVAACMPVCSSHPRFTA